MSSTPPRSPSTSRGYSAALTAFGFPVGPITLLDEVGIPLTPIRLKCALLGLGVLKVALHKAKGTPLPEEWAGVDELQIT